MKQILCISHLPWQAQPTRTQQLLTRLTGAQVLLFEPPAPRGQSQPQQGRRMRSHITVYTLPSPLPDGQERSRRQRRSVDHAVELIRQVMDRHHFRSPVLWCTAPDQAALIDRLPWSGLVYDCFREWGSRYLDQESDLAARADVIFAASPGLVNRLSPCSDNIALLPNGVSPIMFSRRGAAVPEPLRRLAGRPIFGRVGDLTSQVELGPLLAAAQAQPDWAFVLIGRVTRPLKTALARLPNLLLTGPVNAIDLPDYLSSCSVLFDLMRSDRRGCDIIPAHVYEYLATGRPTVMMVEPEQIEPFPDVIYTAYDAAGFLRRCRRALEETPGLADARRREYAQRASWSNRAAEVFRILEDTGLF